MTPLTLLDRISQISHLRRVREFNAAFHSRSDDVFIVSFPKSGTTWLQMIVYQILTDGDLSRIWHICEFSPFWEEDFVFGDLRIPARTSRGVFKSHLGYPFIYHGEGKYIYGVRNGKDVAISFYHHLRNYNNFELGFDEFWQTFLTSGVGAFGRWFDHVSQYADNPDNLNLLFVRYEDLATDLKRTIQKIARFLETELSDEDLERAVVKSTFTYMKQHEEKFDLYHREVRKPGNAAVSGLRPNQFLRNGSSGEWKTVLNSDQIDQFGAMFEQQLGDKGFDQYRS